MFRPHCCPLRCSSRDTVSHFAGIWRGMRNGSERESSWCWAKPSKSHIDIKEICKFCLLLRQPLFHQNGPWPTQEGKCQDIGRVLPSQTRPGLRLAFQAWRFSKLRKDCFPAPGSWARWSSLAFQRKERWLAESLAIPKETCTTLIKLLAHPGSNEQPKGDLWIAPDHQGECLFL